MSGKKCVIGLSGKCSHLIQCSEGMKFGGYPKKEISVSLTLSLDMTMEGPRYIRPGKSGEKSKVENRGKGPNDTKSV